MDDLVQRLLNARDEAADEIERLRAQLAERDRDAERWCYVDEHAAWHRRDDMDGRYASLIVKLPYDADLSCKAMRAAAIDAAMDK